MDVFGSSLESKRIKKICILESKLAELETDIIKITETLSNYKKIIEQINVQIHGVEVKIENLNTNFNATDSTSKLQYSHIEEQINKIKGFVKYEAYTDSSVR